VLQQFVPTQGKVTHIDLSNYDNGVYFIKLLTNDGAIVKRLIKEY
jgi:hypothetical protein